MGGRTRRGTAVTTWTSVVTAVAVVISLGACGPPDATERPSSSGAGTQSESDDVAPYLPNTLLDAPDAPPRLFLVTQSGQVAPRRIAVDWSPMAGPVQKPPDTISWPRGTSESDAGRIVFEFDTTQVPSRVVLYRYPQVGDDGAPDQRSGSETVCGFADPGSECWREGDGISRARVVVPATGTSDPYWVIHAAWPILSGRQPSEEVKIVSASWVIRVGTG